MELRTLLGIVGLALWCITGTTSFGQQQPTPPLAFEVASVKPNSSGTSGGRFVMPPGDRLIAENMQLRALITEAYSAEQAQLVDFPSWINDARYDVAAKAEAPSSVNQLHLMLRTLLADRFKLGVHTEMREGPIFALVVVKSGKLGPSIRPAAEDCAALRAKGTTPGADPCGVGSMANADRLGMIKARGFPLSSVVGLLTRQSGRRVVDKTGLTGPFDWELKWTPQAFLQGSFDRQRFPDIDPDGPSIFTAVQEQWGLKLEPEKDAGKVLVIDHVERPTPN